MVSMSDDVVVMTDSAFSVFDFDYMFTVLYPLLGYITSLRLPLRVDVRDVEMQFIVSPPDFHFGDTVCAIAIQLATQLDHALCTYLSSSFRSSGSAAVGGL